MIPDTFLSGLFLVPSCSLFFVFLAPSWAPSWPQNEVKNIKSRSQKVFFSAYSFSLWNLMFFWCYFMFFLDLQSLPASAGPTKYALLQKSVFSLSNIISDSFLTSFWNFWPPQIGLNRLWEALLNPSDFWSIFGLHLIFFAFWRFLAPRGGPWGSPKF